MNTYIAFLGLIIALLAHVSLGPLFLVFGVVIPVVVVYVWIMMRWVSSEVAIVLAFLGGLGLDLMVSPLLGMHTFAMLISVGAMLLIEHRLLNKKLSGRFVSLCSGIGLYLLLVSQLNIWLT